MSLFYVKIVFTWIPCQHEGTAVALVVSDLPAARRDVDPGLVVTVRVGFTRALAVGFLAHEAEKKDQELIIA